MQGKIAGAFRLNKAGSRLIKKAYDELENERYIKSIQGKGTFVAPKNTELAKEQANKDIENCILKIIEVSNRFDITKQEILDVFEYLYRSDKE